MYVSYEEKCIESLLLTRIFEDGASLNILSSWSGVIELLAMPLAKFCYLAKRLRAFLRLLSISADNSIAVLLTPAILLSGGKSRDKNKKENLICSYTNADRTN